MKKRIVSAILAVLTLCSIMASTALAVEESAQSLRAGVLVCPKCDKGTFYSVSVENGRPTLKAYKVQCEVNDRYNCDIYTQEYTVYNRCSVCAYQYQTGTEFRDYWVHHNH